MASDNENIRTTAVDVDLTLSTDESSDDDHQPKRPKVLKNTLSDDFSASDSDDVQEEQKRPKVLQRHILSDESSNSDDGLEEQKDCDEVNSVGKKKGRFYQENKSLPVFEWNAHTYNVHKIVDALLNNTASLDTVCYCTPTGIEHNCTFLVNQAKLKRAADLRADDSGSWKNNGVRCVIVAVREGNISILVRGKDVKSATMVQGQYQLTRTYFIHHACPDFRKIIFTLCDHNGKTINLAMVQYYFTGNEHPIYKPPHGNSKSSTPYKRTQPSTMERMKELSGKLGPVATVEAIDKETGDIVGQKSSGSRLRNTQQVCNIRRQLKMKQGGDCQLAEAMELCKTGMSGSGQDFVRSVQAAPEPMCILATDQQLDEMMRNCTDPTAFVPMGVDPTFKLGKFFVTPIVFLLRMLVAKRTGKSPIYMGAMLVHQSLKFSSFHYFVSQIIGLRPSLKNVKAIGTDGEGPLYEAFCGSFPNAIHLRCFTHFQRNIEDKLKQFQFPSHVIKEIIHDIMGVQIGSDKYQGLVDADNEADFREKLSLLKQRWDTFESSHRCVPRGKLFQPEFYSWFQSEKADVVVKCMLPDIRKKAGLGREPDHFYTNMSESLNNVLKCRTEYKEQEFRSFVEKMYDFVQSQESLLRKAVIRTDRWRFREEYKYLEIDSDKWFGMSEKAQKIHLKKVYSEPLGMKVHEELPEELTVEEQPEENPLSVDYKSLIDTARIPTGSLKDIWLKAKRLVAVPGLVVPVPGQPTSSHRMVASEHNEPHHVVSKPSNQFTCSGICPRFSTYKICQHIVAAAETACKLVKFCEWWKKQSNSPDIESLAMLGLPKGVAGQKGSVPKRSRRGRTRSSTVTAPVSTHDRTTCVTNIQTTVANDMYMGSTMNFGFSSYPSASVYPTHHYFPQYSPHGSQYSPHGSQYPPHGSHDQYGSQYSPHGSQYSSQYSPHGSQPYLLKFLTKQIRICAGCRLSYCHDPDIPPPPYNICIAHEETRQITNPHTNIPFSKKTTVHYHANPECIWIKDPSFFPQSLQIPPDVDAKLQPEHRDFLHHYFQVN